MSRKCWGQSDLCLLQASSFFLPDIVGRVCGCGACFAFNVPMACKFVGSPGASTEAKLRTWIRRKKSGCTGRNINVVVGGKKKCLTGCHVKKDIYPDELVNAMEAGQFWLLSLSCCNMLLIMTYLSSLALKCMKAEEGLQDSDFRLQTSE